MNKLSDEEKNIKKALEEFEIPFSTAAWEKAEKELDKRAKKAWYFKSLIGLFTIALLCVSLYVFLPSNSPVEDKNTVAKNTTELTYVEEKNTSNTSKNKTAFLDKKENQHSAKIETNSLNPSQKNIRKHEDKNELSKDKFNSKKPLYIVKNNNDLEVKNSQNNSESKNPFVLKNETDFFESNSKENEKLNNGTSEKDSKNIEDNKSNKLKETNTNPLAENQSLTQDKPFDKTQIPEKESKKEQENTIEENQKTAKKDSLENQNKGNIEPPPSKVDSRFILGIFGGLTSYKKLAKQKTYEYNFTPVLGIYIQKNIKQKFSARFALTYNQLQLQNISKTYTTSTYSFGKCTESVTVTPYKLHLLHSNISLVYQHSNHWNFQLGATYIYAINTQNNFEENTKDAQNKYKGNSKFFNGYQAIPAVQFGTEYLQKNGIRYGAYLQQGMKSLVNEKYFGTVQSKTLFNLNLYLAYDLSRF